MNSRECTASQHTKIWTKPSQPNSVKSACYYSIKVSREAFLCFSLTRHRFNKSITGSHFIAQQAVDLRICVTNPPFWTHSINDCLTNKTKTLKKIVWALDTNNCFPTVLKVSILGIIDLNSFTELINKPLQKGRLFQQTFPHISNLAWFKTYRNQGMKMTDFISTLLHSNF